MTSWHVEAESTSIRRRLGNIGNCSARQRKPTLDWIQKENPELTSDRHYVRHRADRCVCRACVDRAGMNDDSRAFGLARVESLFSLLGQGYTRHPVSLIKSSLHSAHPLSQTTIPHHTPLNALNHGDSQRVPTGIAEKGSNLSGSSPRAFE